jgi:DNA polymerase-3 subunit delta'
MKLEAAQGLLESAHERGRLAHALILSGPAGSGKQELAANLIQHLNQPKDEGADLWGEPIEVEAKPLDELEGEFVRIVRPKSRSRQIKVEQMRELEKPLHLAAPTGTWKVGVIIDADRMGEAAANAFLKTLEEPPDDCLLLLVTASPARLLPTILSRCVEISLVNRLGMEERLQDRTRELERALAEVARQGPSVWAALGVKATFEEILANWKAERDKHFADELKAENALYKNSSEGKWLQEREEAMKAELAGELVEARQALVQWLAAWMGDAVRARYGCDRLDLPGQEEYTKAFGQSQDLPSLLRRTDSLGEMASLLETNAQDNLVLETCLLGAFS